MLTPATPRLAGVYVHLPFCDVKCAYCDFYSVAARHVDAAFWPRYTEKLKSDLNHQFRLLREDSPGIRLASIFFGGGTPSKAPEFVFREIIEHARSLLDKNTERIEITAEANPESLTVKVANDWAKAGINRVSVGMQSREAAVLKYLGRLYNPQAYNGVLRIVRDAGITNINTDFITGVPGQTLRSTLADLDFAIAEGVSHMSLYQLTIEPGTLLKQRIESGRAERPSDTRQLRQMQIAARHLERAGLMRYEISNFSKPDRACLHNLIYWTNRPYAGIGVAAHAFTGKRRYFNVRSLEKYNHPDNLPEEDIHAQPRDALINLLRLTRQVNIVRVKRLFAANLHSRIDLLLESAAQRGFINLGSKTFRLTSRGLTFTDTLIAEFWNL